MSNLFPAFAKLVAGSLQEILRGPSHVVELGNLYERYLAAFPEGTNPLFKTRTEHECGCCKHFVRRVGGVVAIGSDLSLSTVWDVAAERAPTGYREVAAAMRDAVRKSMVVDLFRVGEKEASFGAELSRSLDKATGQVRTWDHFYTGEIPRTFRIASPDQVRGDYRTTVQVFERGLFELTADAVDTVLSLIEANNLYRGEEHRPAVVGFQKMQRQYLALADDGQKRRFAWANASSPGARFRNTVIGTLVQDLSEGQDVEHAVRSFETKVAPQNYKRTTAVITPAMVKRAMETIQSLGLEPALERRFAVIGDVSVTDVKWVDGAVKPLMRGGIGDALMKHAVAASGGDRLDEQSATDITLDDLVERVLPDATGLEILFRGGLTGNLMSLTAPCSAEPARLFRWSNNFAWSYGGNVADSIKERVKKAGGKIEGALRVSLSWSNFDDLDLHISEPTGRGVNVLGGHIYFRARRGWTGGELDVDMNAGRGTTREPVENVVWQRPPPDGKYEVVVNNYCLRESSDPGFVVEVESDGRLSHYSYSKGVRNAQNIHVASLHLHGGRLEKIEVGDSAITASNISREKWGLHTEQFCKVAAVMLSPNYWGENAVGNKHTFFVLDGAKNDEPTRGFYNEFLNPRLEPHRKVFEVIADKTKCRPTDGQLSGLGFSSTKRESFVARVLTGKKRRLFNVQVVA